MCVPVLRRTGNANSRSFSELSAKINRIFVLIDDHYANARSILAFPTSPGTDP